MIKTIVFSLGFGVFFVGHACADPMNKQDFALQNLIGVDCHAPSHDFREGLAAVCVKGKWGYIDTKGGFAIAPRFLMAEDFHGGLAWAATVEKKGYINKNGEFQIITDEAYYDSPFVDGLAKLKHKTTFNWGFIDKTGKYVIPPDLYWAANFSEGLAVATKNGRTVYISKSGRIAFAPGKEIFDCGNFSEGLAAVDTNAGAGYIDSAGRFAVKPNKALSKTQNFKEGLAVVEMPGEFRPTYAHIDKSGAFITQERYLYAKDFSEGLAAVAQLSDLREVGYIDRLGKYVIKPQYEEAEGFHEGLAAVKKDGKWGYIDKAGAFIIPAKYDSANGFVSGVARVNIFGRTDYIDKTGNSILFPKTTSKSNATSPAPQAVSGNIEDNVMRGIKSLLVPSGKKNKRVILAEHIASSEGALDGAGFESAWGAQKKDSTIEVTYNSPNNGYNQGGAPKILKWAVAKKGAGYCIQPKNNSSLLALKNNNYKDSVVEKYLCDGYCAGAQSGNNNFNERGDLPCLDMELMSDGRYALEAPQVSPQARAALARSIPLTNKVTLSERFESCYSLWMKEKDQGVLDEAMKQTSSEHDCPELKNRMYACDSYRGVLFNPKMTDDETIAAAKRIGMNATHKDLVDMRAKIRRAYDENECDELIRVINSR